MEHSKLLWSYEIVQSTGFPEPRCAIRATGEYFNIALVSQSDAAFIVQACNQHQRLVDALKASLSDLKYYKAVEDSLSQTNIRLLDPTSTIATAQALLDEVAG